MELPPSSDELTTALSLFMTLSGAPAGGAGGGSKASKGKKKKKGSGGDAGGGKSGSGGSSGGGDAAAAAVAAASAAREGKSAESTHEQLIALLTAEGVEFTVSEHEAVRTSEEAAAVRGVSLASGAKAMLLRKGKDAEAPFKLAVMSASEKLSWKLAKKAIAKGLSMATEEEVFAITGCLPGAVPPLSAVFFGAVPTFVDESLIAQGDRINFNAGLRTHSVSMLVTDFLRISAATVTTFC